MTLMKTVSRVLPGGDPREVPHWTQPIVFEETQCVYLGDHAGRRWFDWPAQRLEVEEVGELLSPDSPAISNTPYFKIPQADGSYLLQPLRAHVRGTYAARLAVVGKGPAAPAAQAPIDVLNSISLLTGYGGAGRYAFRGGADIIARFKANGIEFKPVGDGSDVLVTAAAGAFLNKYREDIALVSPLVVPYLISGAIYCEVSKHKSPVEAVTLAFAIPDPMPWCLACGGQL